MSKIELLIGGKKYEGSLGLGFLGEALENLDLDIVQIGAKVDKNPFKYAPILIYESIKYNNTDIDLTLDKLIELLDSPEGLKNINKFIIAFVKSLTKNVPKEEPTVDAGPKKK